MMQKRSRMDSRVGVDGVAEVKAPTGSDDGSLNKRAKRYARMKASANEVMRRCHFL